MQPPYDKFTLYITYIWGQASVIKWGMESKWLNYIRKNLVEGHHWKYESLIVNTTSLVLLLNKKL
jgi:hypothetical protein